MNGAMVSRCLQLSSSNLEQSCFTEIIWQTFFSLRERLEQRNERSCDSRLEFSCDKLEELIRLYWSKTFVSMQKITAILVK